MPTVQVGQTKINYQEAGTGEPLVLLHGLGSNSRSWRHQLAGLAQSFRVLAWDAPGYGLSDDLAVFDGPAFTMADFAHVLGAFFDALKIDQAHIVGHSMGGVLALEFYQHYRERVKSLVLADTNRGGGAKPQAERQATLQRRLHALATQTPAQIAQARAPGLLSPHADAVLVADVSSIYAEIRPAGYRLATLGLDRANHTDLLPQVNVPTLILCGELDTVTPPAESEILAQNIPHADLKFIPRAGHSSNQEQPQVFNRLVLDFLQSDYLKVGIIGTGSIGTFLLESIAHGLGGRTRAVAFAARQPATSYGRELAAKYNCAECVGPLELLEYQPDIIIEAANAQVVRECAKPIIEAGCDLMVMSAGVLSDPEFLASLKSALQQHGRRLYVPSGAIGGLDVVRAAVGDLDEVRLITSKPPHALANAPFFEQAGYTAAQITTRTVIFQGTAEQAIQLFPQNINVAAILSLAGLGVARTLVEIMADPNIKCNQHEIIVRGGFGEMRLNLTNVPNPHNPKTSLLACLSPLALLRRLSDPIWIGS